MGIIYSRCSPDEIDERATYGVDDLPSIVSVIRDIQFFVHEKWRIASDKRGSGNTANIGSIRKIQDLLDGNGTFAEYGEQWFDDYWINYGRIPIADQKNTTRPIKTFEEFMDYRGRSPRS